MAHFDDVLRGVVEVFGRVVVPFGFDFFDEWVGDREARVPEAEIRDCANVAAGGVEPGDGDFYGEIRFARVVEARWVVSRDRQDRANEGEAAIDELRKSGWEESRSTPKARSAIERITSAAPMMAGDCQNGFASTSEARCDCMQRRKHALLGTTNQAIRPFAPFREMWFARVPQ